jgi:hypothetical protein
MNMWNEVQGEVLAAARKADVERMLMHRRLLAEAQAARGPGASSLGGVWAGAQRSLGAALVALGERLLGTPVWGARRQGTMRRGASSAVLVPARSATALHVAHLVRPAAERRVSLAVAPVAPPRLVSLPVHRRGHRRQSHAVRW